LDEKKRSPLGRDPVYRNEPSGKRPSAPTAKAAVPLGEPYARSHQRIATHFLEFMRGFDEIVLPIQHEIFGTE
jgi:hypothetical protein